MSEPALAASVATGVAVGITGTFLGISYDVLLAGFGAGIVVVSMTDGIKPAKAISTVFVSLITAGCMSDLLAIIVSGKTNLPTEYLRSPIAFLIGFLAQAVLLPGITGLGKWLFTKAQKVLGQKIDEVTK
jgi:hypothetical protein